MMPAGAHAGVTTYGFAGDVIPIGTNQLYASVPKDTGTRRRMESLRISTTDSNSIQKPP
jgi:hypothetical protein